ncbi:MAG: PTS transporter subunit EIIB, partial [Bacillales bacterium]
MKKEKKLAQDILQQIGGGDNIQSLNYCMTRLRLDLRDRSKVNMSALKNIDGVLGVVDDETLQIIVGPGVVNKVASEISEITDVKLGEALDVQEDDVAALTKAKIKKKNETPLKNLLRKIGNIFIPLIPGLVASGLINGAVGFAKNAGVDPTLTWVQILSLLGGAVFGYLAILVGLNTAREFGGTPVLGAIAGILIINPALADITLFGNPLVPGRGGLIGA